MKARARGRLGLLLADVCGKGMPAALLGASVQAAVRACAMATDCPCGEVLARTNRLLFERIGPDRFVTVFFGAYDPGTRILEYANPALGRPRYGATAAREPYAPPPPGVPASGPST